MGLPVQISTDAIEDNAVTLGKLQELSARRILGNPTDSPGDTQEITLSAFATTILDDADSATMRTTLSAAGLADSNTFTAAQIITPSTDVVGLTINHSTTKNYLEIKNGATTLAGIDNTGRFFSHLGTPSSNFFMAELAGNKTVTGAGNLGIGYSAGASITSGNFNYFLGYAAGATVSTGSNNVAIGTYALANLDGGDNNIGIGTVAGLLLASGVGNTIIGPSAARNITYGNYNLIIGYQAGYSNVGHANIFLGFGAGYRQTTLGSGLIIDNNIRASATEETTNAIIYGSMGATPGAQTMRINAVTSVILDNAATTSTVDVFTLQANSTGTVSAGFGTLLTFKAETATADTAQPQAIISTSWIDPTDATRKAKLQLAAYDTSPRIGLAIEASGSAAKIAFYGGTTVARGAALTTADANAINTGDATTDAVIANMRTRINELEARLGSVTGVNLFA